MKFIKTSPDAAYEIAVGVTAEEAAEAKLAVVEQSYSTNPPTPIYGRYLDAPKGHPLGVTVDKPGNTEVIGAGSVGSPGPSGGGDKGQLVNLNDPVIHGGTGDESVHADNSPPLVEDTAEQERVVRAGAHDPQKAPATGKDAKANTK
jgi:hypothetical protein